MADSGLTGPAATLGIVIATYNRRESLEVALDSIERTTHADHRVVVVDGGSTDGTLEFLSERGIRTIRQGELVGSARAYNTGFAALDTKYVCWLSDDTDVLEGALDTAVTCLAGNTGIGMVGLKMVEAKWGPTSRYAGAVWPTGVLTCNHGVLRLDVLRALGGFHEPYRAYTIDPDLTASVLACGLRVVMTKRHAVLHRRMEPVDMEGKMTTKDPASAAKAIYQERWSWLEERPRSGARRLVASRYRELIRRWPKRGFRFRLCRRDLEVLADATWVSVLDPLASIGKPYHLVQSLPSDVVRDPRNPVAPGLRVT